MDPTKRPQLERLCGAINASYDKLDKYRKSRVEALRQYVGAHYSENGAPEPVPLNFIELAVGVYCRQLVARNPKPLITTPIKELRATAFNLQLGVEQVIREIRLKKTLRRVVKEAMFGPGVMKIGIAESARGFTEDPGEMFASIIDPDDWVQDMQVRVYEHSSFAGHRYRRPLSEVLGNPEFDQSALKGFTSDVSQPMADDETAHSIGSEQSFADEESEDYIELWDIWLPREGLIVTLLGASRGGRTAVDSKVLRIIEWDGPKNGPFLVLSFNDVPGNVMPLAPVALLRDLHDLANELYRKLGRDEVNAKTLTLYRGEAAEDAQRVVEAAHGDTIKSDAPDKINQVTYNGARPEGIGFGIGVQENQNIFSGNVKGIGGLAPQADTLGQERIIAESASQRIQDMQDCVIDFTTEAVRYLAWYELTNPLLDRLVTKPIPYTNRSVEVRLTNEKLSPLAARFLDLNFEIEVYSLQPRSPMERLAALKQLLDNFVIPFLGQLDAQGTQLDFDSLLRTAARYVGVHEFDDFMLAALPPRVPQQGMRGEDPRTSARPATTTRRQVRVSTQGPVDSSRLMSAFLTQPKIMQPMGAGQ